MNYTAYLSEFFTRFDYPQPARVALTAAYDSILQNKDAQDLWDRYLTEYISDIHCDFIAQLNGCSKLAHSLPVSPYTLQLLLFICHSEHTLALYRAHGLDEQIWYDSMCDLKYKLLECHEVYGVWGSFVADWFPRFFQLERFALGRLQFEWVRLGHDYTKNGVVLTPDSQVIQLHIPRSGEPLDAERCDDAFRRAIAFYTPQAKEHGIKEDEPLVFTCSSWLLYPENETILPERSNIRAFMHRFDIYRSSVHGGDHPDLWRLFDTMEKKPDRLPANTSLRRAYIEHLKKGGKTGCGHGIYVPNICPIRQ